MVEYVKDSEYLPQMYKMLCAIEENEAEAMNRAAQAIYASLQKGGILHVFATGHSHMIADELFYRSGGLAPVNPLLVSDIMVYEGAVHSTLVERQSGVAKRILDKFELRAGDCLLIASNSGINIAAIEAAELAKERGLTVICVTSVKTSRALVSRHPEGKKLYQVGDIIIDNHSPEGDGLLEVPQNGQRTGGASTFGILFIAQRIVLKVENRFIEQGEIPPVFRSANIPGGDEFNRALLERYKERIAALRR